MVVAGTGSFRHFERFSLLLVAGNLLLVPVFLMVHLRRDGSRLLCAETARGQPFE